MALRNSSGRSHLQRFVESMADYTWEASCTSYFAHSITVFPFQMGRISDLFGYRRESLRQGKREFLGGRPTSSFRIATHSLSNFAEVF
jgi:hypothetical protein